MGSVGAVGNVGAAYQAAMASRSNSQQKIDGDNAIRLVEAAQLVPTANANANRALPPDATISIRA
ncbi:MAG: hypothetical protein ABUL77_03180 [Bacteroidota bacterium]